MKVKGLRDIANGLVAMFGGPRTPEDLEVLAQLPDGLLQIDLLNGVAEHSTYGRVRLKATDDFANWLQSRLAAYAIPLSELKEAILEVAIDTQGIPTNKNRIVSFDLNCKSRLSTAQKTFEGKNQKHVWHQRNGA